MTTVLYEFAISAQLTDDVDELIDAFSLALEGHGYDKFVYANCQAYGGTRHAFIINKVPSKWWDHYFKNNYETHDPSIHALAQCVLPVRWVDIYESANTIGRRCLDDAARFGLTHGIIVPIRGGSEDLFAVTASGRSDYISLAEVAEIQAICNIFHHHHRLLTRESVPALKLTKRQKEYLTWIAEGKTMPEIAVISNVTTNAVQDRLREAYRRLGVNNVQGAVARAMAYNLIQPNVFSNYEMET